ncbi:HD family hydrolase [uncultured Alistipes sp.]|uniref:HD domain-containing protein n=1 Tax=uncultured Alistipes sp. TaxID=538949 RepID=UPI00261BE2B5|nr:HD domain-containing protein [uncultured Alistipes sp.]
MEEKLKRYIRFIEETERLKSVVRSARTSTGRRESTAEHSWRLALLALVLRDEYPALDAGRVLDMCLVHDLGEAYDGDLPAVERPDPALKASTERRALIRLASLLPEQAARRIAALWEEYETGLTPETRFVKALDKAETILQHNQGANPADFDYAFNLGYGAAWFADDPLLRTLRRLLDAETARHIER